MKQCVNCGANLADNAIFCTACGQKCDAAQSVQPTVQQQREYFVPAEPADNRKAYCIMSYISLLWLFGLLCSPEKNDPRVRFNVGQGIISSIISAGLGIIAWILSAIFNAVFVVEKTVYGVSTGITEPSVLAGALSTFVWLIAIGMSVFFSVWGIVKVCQNKDTYLPIIGRFAFYR